MLKRRVINTKELAEMLGYTPQSIRNKLSRIKKGIEPASALPQKINHPGFPKWDIREVERWLSNSAELHKPATAKAQKSKNERYVGRPRKALPAEFRV